MKKTHNLRLTDDQYKLAIFALGFTEGAMRRSCQFEVSDALIALIRKIKEQETQHVLPAAKAAKAG